MPSLHRVYGIILRVLYEFVHNADRQIDTFFWPTVDLVLWGITSYFVEQTVDDSFGAILNAIISGILLWVILRQVQTDINFSLLSEIWNRNLFNIFATPVRFSEFLLGGITTGLIKAIIAIAFGNVVALLLYKTGSFKLGFALIPFMILLIMSGWWFGFLVNGLILRFGTKVQSSAWALLFVISPFSAVYYPMEILPGWTKTIAALLPTSYVFEGMRQVLSEGFLDWQKVFISFILNLFYIAVATIWLNMSFKAALNKGLLKIH